MRHFLTDIITEAGRISLDYRSRLSSLQVDHKSQKDLVTEADVAVENYLVNQIKATYPDHSIVAEESGTQEGSEYRWIIDPIDGTTSFAHGLPIYSISIALQKNNQTTLAAVYGPVLGELFMAEAGHGAALNGRPIRVSESDTLTDCLCTTGFACLRANLPDNNLPAVNRIAPKLRGMRILGSAALDLCYVACGRTDGSWERNLKVYDITAGALICTEAGGTVTDFSGKSTDNLPGQIMATNGKIHAELSKLLMETNDKG